jgi:hypothetical protein
MKDEKSFKSSILTISLEIVLIINFEIDSISTLSLY